MISNSTYPILYQKERSHVVENLETFSTVKDFNIILVFYVYNIDTHKLKVYLEQKRETIKKYEK